MLQNKYLSNGITASYVESSLPTSSIYCTASRSLYFSRPKSSSFSVNDRTSRQWSLSPDHPTKCVSSIPNIKVNRMYDEAMSAAKSFTIDDRCASNEVKKAKSDEIEIKYSKCLGNDEEEEDANSQKDEGFVENAGYDMVEQQKIMKVTSITMLEFAHQVSAGMVSVYKPFYFKVLVEKKIVDNTFLVY